LAFHCLYVELAGATVVQFFTGWTKPRKF